MTAKDLLIKVLEYKHIWGTPDKIKTEQGKIRLAQIESLQEALGLSIKHVNPLNRIKYSFSGEQEKLSRAKFLKNMTDLDYLTTGEFLNDRATEENNELNDIVINKIKKIFENPPVFALKQPVDISWLFSDLLSYRTNIFKVVYHSVDLQEAFSTGLEYSKYLKTQLNNTIGRNIGQIDDTLWMILDPKKRKIKMSTLEIKYNYPNVELENVDN